MVQQEEVDMSYWSCNLTWKVQGKKHNRRARIPTAREGGNGGGGKIPVKRFVKISKYFVHTQCPVHTPSAQMSREVPVPPGRSIWTIKISLCDRLLQSGLLMGCSEGAACRMPGAAGGKLPLPVPAASGRGSSHVALLLVTDWVTFCSV